MNKDIAMAWADELESGKHEQGRSYLETVDDGVSRLCCLGVLSLMAAEAGVCERRVSSLGNVTFHDKDVDDDIFGAALLTDGVKDWADMVSIDGQRYDQRNLVEGRVSPTLTVLNDGRSSEFGFDQAPMPFPEIAKVIRDNYEYL